MPNLKLDSIEAKVRKLKNSFYKQCNLIIDEIKKQLSEEIKNKLISGKVNVMYRDEDVHVQFDSEKKVGNHRSAIASRSVDVRIKDHSRISVWYFLAENGFTDIDFKKDNLTVNQFFKEIPNIKNFFISDTFIIHKFFWKKLKKEKKCY
jgi:hypothetical protein